MRVIALTAALHRFTFEIKWICSKDNVIADLATRVSLETFMLRCSDLRRFNDVVMPPKLADPHWEDRICQQGMRLNQGRLPPPLYPRMSSDRA